MSKKLDLKDFTQKSVIGSVDYAKVKSALTNRNLGELCKIYELFIRFDSQVSAEIDIRRKQIASLPYLLTCENEIQREFLEDYLNSGDFRLFLFALTSAIPYGFSVFLKQWQNQNGRILPNYHFLEHSFFNDEKGRLYFSKMGDKSFLDETDNTFTYLHASDTGDFINSALMYKVVCIASLKMLVINQNINYFENLAVPPIVLQTEKSAVDNPAELDEAINTLLSLRSNSVAVIGKDDVLNLLTGNTDKESFLNFIRYCDECISKVITGEVLSANATVNGTNALGNIHERQKQITTEFDAITLAGGVSVVLRHILKLNFADPAEFKFSFDTNTETQEEAQSIVYERLVNMGYEIPIEHIQNVFKIDGITKRGKNERSDGSAVISCERSEAEQIVQKSEKLSELNAILAFLQS